MLELHRDFRDFGNRSENRIHWAFGAADMGLISAILMGQADNGFWLAVIIRASRDIKTVNGPRPLHADGFA